MATNSGSASAFPSGYGTSAASAAQSIPELDGNRKSFSDFDWKLKAVALDLNLDDILLRPAEWQATVRALQQRVDGRAGPSTRSSSSTAVDPATQADQSQLQAELAKSKLLARILIDKLKPSVSQILRDTLPEEEQFNPISIYLLPLGG